MIRLIGRALSFGNHAAIWQAIRPRERVEFGWWWQRFTAACDVVVERWGPRSLAGRKVLGHYLATWALAGLWLGLPAVMIGRILQWLAF